jgi:hypothetical protein
MHWSILIKEAASGEHSSNQCSRVLLLQVNATLMNIADNPTNVQLPGMYNVEDIPRVPVIATGA